MITFDQEGKAGQTIVLPGCGAGRVIMLAEEKNGYIEIRGLTVDSSESLASAFARFSSSASLISRTRIK